MRLHIIWSQWSYFTIIPGWFTKTVGTGARERVQQAQYLEMADQIQSPAPHIPQAPAGMIPELEVNSEHSQVWTNNPPYKRCQ